MAEQQGLSQEEMEWYAEADRRGLLSGEEKEWWDAGVKQGYLDPHAGQAYYEVEDSPGFLAGVGETLRNLPGDAVRTGGELLDAAMHPIETSKNVALLAGGLAQKGVRAVHDMFSDTPMEVPQGGVHEAAEKMADAVIDHYRQYGDRGLEMVRERPVQAAMDFLPVTQLAGKGAALGRAGLGKVTAETAAGQAGLKAAQGALAGVEKVAAAADPFKWPGAAWEGAKWTAGKTVVPYVTETFSPGSIYSRAVGAGPRTKTNAQRKAMTEAGLAEEIPVTPEGMIKAQQAGERLHGEVLERVAQADKAGAAGISSQEIVSRARRKLEEQYGGRGADTMRNIDEALESWKKEMPDHLTMSDAQVEKQRISRAYRGDPSWNKDRVGEANKAAREQVARELRAEIESQVQKATGQSVHGLNARHQALMDLEKEIDAAVNRQGNYKTNLIGLPGQMMAGGAAAGAALGGPWGAAIGGGLGQLAGDFIRNPSTQARIAIALNKGLKRAAKEGRRLAAKGGVITQSRLAQLVKKTMSDPHIQTAVKYGYLTPGEVTHSILDVMGQQK